MIQGRRVRILELKKLEDAVQRHKSGGGVTYTAELAVQQSDSRVPSSNEQTITLKLEEREYEWLKAHIGTYHLELVIRHEEER